MQYFIATIFTVMFVMSYKNNQNYRKYLIRYQLPLLILVWFVPIFSAINPKINQTLDRPIFGIIFLLLLGLFVGISLKAKSNLKK